MRVLILLGLWGCAGTPAPETPAGWGATRPTQGGKYKVDLAITPDPPPMGELFRVDAVVSNKDGTPLDGGKVKLNALMPQHGHGMATEPQMDPGQCDENKVCKHPDGKYWAEGFKFHMGGEWTITVEVEGPLGPDSTSFVYEMAG